MARRSSLSQFVETYRFWDIVTLWARERLEHEEIVARALAQGIVRGGLCAHSVDPQWIPGNEPKMEFRGYPYVGFRASPNAAICILRASALEHLLAVVRKGTRPARARLAEEFVSRNDFSLWASLNNIPLPEFWFGALGTTSSSWS